MTLEFQTGGASLGPGPIPTRFFPLAFRIRS